MCEDIYSCVITVIILRGKEKFSMNRLCLVICGFAKSEPTNSQANQVLIEGQMRVLPEIEGSAHGREVMVLDTGSPHTWTWSHDSLVPLGLGQLGGILLETVTERAIPGHGLVTITYADNDSFTCSSWIHTTFRMLGIEWSQPVGIVSSASVRAIPEFAGVIGASVRSSFAKSVGVFGVEPVLPREGLSRIFFHLLLENQCHDQRVIQSYVGQDAYHWQLDSLLRFGSREFRTPTVLDTGSSIMVLPNEVYNSFVNEIHSRNVSLLQYSDNLLQPGIVDCSAIASLPVLTFHLLESDYSVKVTPWMYIEQQELSRICMIKVTPGGDRIRDMIILGVGFFRHYSVAFDAVHRRVSICIPAGLYSQRMYGPLGGVEENSKGYNKLTGSFVISFSVLLRLV